MLKSTEVVNRPRLMTMTVFVMMHSTAAIIPMMVTMMLAVRMVMLFRSSLLSLPRPCHVPTARGTIRRPISKTILLREILRRSKSLRPARQSSPHLLHIRHLLILHLHKSTRRAASTLLNRLLERRDINPNKQHEITAQNPHPCECRKFLPSADSCRRQPREILRGEISVGGEVDETEIDDELDDLEDGDVFLPPDADAARGLEVVPVHYDVHGEVEGYGDPGDGGVAEELGEAEEGGGAVVVGVEEGEGFLFEEEEDGVD